MSDWIGLYQHRWFAICRHTASLFAVVVLFVSVGCSEFRPPTSDELARGYVLLLPGVRSEGDYMGGMIGGIRDGGVDNAIDMDRWGVWPFGSLTNLMNYEANRKEARRLADKITAYHREYPAAPVSIVGYSGGGGLAIFTAEALPREPLLDRVVLMGAALSPDYDLSEAIARCRRGVVNIYSEQDWVQIGLGTEMLGTMDRKKTTSAGCRGFQSADGRLLQRSGLEQIKWVPQWREYGHGGDHYGYLLRPWAYKVLAPLLRRTAYAGLDP